MLKSVCVIDVYPLPSLPGVLVYPLLKASVPNQGSHEYKVVILAFCGGQLSSSRGEVLLCFPFVVCSGTKFPDGSAFRNEKDTFLYFGDTVPPVSLRSVSAREPIVLQIRAGSSHEASNQFCDFLAHVEWACFCPLLQTMSCNNLHSTPRSVAEMNSAPSYFGYRGYCLLRLIAHRICDFLRCGW